MTIKVQGPSLMVKLQGELDHHTASELRDRIDGAYERSPCRHILFDFTRVSFMDSSGIGMIIGRYKNAEKRGGKVALANMGRPLEKIFSLSGLQKIVGSYPTVAEAEKALAEGGVMHG
jgi:stage II sporulation protein AA (anti-sigma F factor antagonist)